MSHSATRSAYQKHSHKKMLVSLWRNIHIDPLLLSLIMLLLGAGLLILYSAGNQSFALISRQGARLSIALIGMVFFAQIPPRKYYQWIPIIFGLSLLLLIAVLVMGHIGKGAQRWLNLGLLRFQPSEMMKIAVPMMIAWYLHHKPLPPSLLDITLSSLIFIVPFALVARQPDLGTALLIATAGASVLLLAGIGWRLLVSIFSMLLISMPVAWHYLHSYQRARVLTFFNPERDPLGAGYHIIQSKIAIGSGGLVGKGWLNGTQSHLQFLPEHATDFIFAVCGEEFGFIGSLVLISLFLAIVARGLYISTCAQDTFTRLLAGSITIMFFLSFFINIGMVSGILPVVGLPLPLVSYGGTSVVTLMAGFGIIMSVHTHRQLVSR